MLNALLQRGGRDCCVTWRVLSVLALLLASGTACVIVRRLDVARAGLWGFAQGGRVGAHGTDREYLTRERSCWSAVVPYVQIGAQRSFAILSIRSSSCWCLVCTVLTFRRTQLRRSLPPVD